MRNCLGLTCEKEVTAQKDYQELQQTMRTQVNFNKEQQNKQRLLAEKQTDNSFLSKKYIVPKVLVTEPEPQTLDQLFHTMDYNKRDKNAIEGPTTRAHTSSHNKPRGKVLTRDEQHDQYLHN